MVSNDSPGYNEFAEETGCFSDEYRKF
ncbi:type II toxin-antitoxin system CcdA family antitoxin [Escherichia coli]|nr:type II toxin-antitoxin system CcdA family antitoxin [Escherichia coli]